MPSSRYELHGGLTMHGGGHHSGSHDGGGVVRRVDVGVQWHVRRVEGQLGPLARAHKVRGRCAAAAVASAPVVDVLLLLLLLRLGLLSVVVAAPRAERAFSKAAARTCRIVVLRMGHLCQLSRVPIPPAANGSWAPVGEATPELQAVKNHPAPRHKGRKKSPRSSPTPGSASESNNDDSQDEDAAAAAAKHAMASPPAPAMDESA